MANRDDNPNGQTVSHSKGQLIRLGAEPGSLVPVGGPSDNRPARRTRSSGDPVDTSAALGALTTALTTLGGQLERERARADKAEARVAQKAATEEAAALRQELKRRRSTGLRRLGRLARAWEGE